MVSVSLSQKHLEENDCIFLPSVFVMIRMGDFPSENRGKKCNHMSSPKLWTKDFILIVGTNFFTHIVFYMLMVIVTVYTMTTFDANEGIAGLATGSFVLASLVARIFSGKYMDIIGRKKVLVIGLVIFTIAMGLHLFINSLIMLFIIRIIHGAAHGFVTTTAGAVSAEIIPDNRRGEGTGYYVTGMNIAMAIGPFIALFLYEHISLQAIFLVGLVISLIDLVITVFIKVPNLQINEDQPKKMPKRSVISGFIEPKAVPISIAIFIISIGYSGLLSFLSAYSKVIGLVEVSSFFFVIYAGALIITRPFTGKWFDLYGANKVNYPLIACLIIGFILLSMANGPVTFLLSGALIGIGFGTLLSNFQAIAIIESPKEHKGLATTTFFIFLDLANGLGAFLIGLLVSTMNFRMVYMVVALIILVGGIFYYFAHGKKVSKGDHLV